ncbi:aBC-type transport system permease and ATPase components [Coprobacillus sp. CAG:698]|nr:aBC-type transport system permease and ATPase components [Coprobacillus sp. CAG:698]
MLFGKHINEYYLKYGIVLLTGIVALLLVDYFQLKIPDIVGDIVDGLQFKTLTKDKLKDYVLLLGVVAIVMFFGRFIWRICLFGTGIRVECNLRNKVFKNMQFLSQRFFQENKTGNLMSIYTNDLTLIRQSFGMGTMMLVDAVCLGAMALYKMFSLNALLSIFSLVSLVLVTLCSSLIGKKITKATENNFKAYGALSDFVQEDFSGISVIKAFVLEKLQVKLFSKYNTENMDSTLVMTKLSVKLNIIITVILSFVNIGIIVYGGYLIYLRKNGLSTNLFSVGDLIKFSAYFGTLIWPIEAVGRLIDMHSQGKASLNRVCKIIDAEKEINDSLVTEECKNITTLEGDIEYRNLSFSYPNDSKKVLHNVNLKINKGEFVGIIGETGSGKTTIVDLLLRLYNIDANMLFIDDHDIMNLPLKTVRNNIAYVPQDNFLYGDKITKNIAFSEVNEIDIDKVYETANISGVKNDIDCFKNGFDTVLGERGITISGGQKQRVSIARALYKNANILILDDSLSAVDTETEKTIITNLRNIRRGKTTIIIAHRITTLQNLDKIVVVNDETITGVGTHEELLKTNASYAREAYLQDLEKEVDSNE